MADFVELRDYALVVLRRWWLVLLSLIMTVSIGYAYVQSQEPVYKATASILVGQSIQATNLGSQEFRVSEELAQTYAVLSRRQPVLQGTVDALGLDIGWQQLKGQVSASMVAETQLVEIVAEARSREEARLIADEVARQLILLSPTALADEKTSERIAFVNQRLESLQAKIDDGQQRLTELESTDLTGLSAAEVNKVQNDINTVEKLLIDWELGYAQLLGYADASRSANHLAMVDSAVASPRAVRPNVQIIMGVAVAVGLALGVALAFILDHMDDTLKTIDDLKESMGIPVLGSIQKMKVRNEKQALVAARARFSPESESYRMVRSNVQFMSVIEPSKSLLVTSAMRGEGKSVTIANLGIVMAQAGIKTIIVDTDLRGPVQHELFELPNKRGLTELFRDPEIQATELLKSTQVPELMVLTSGVLPPNPSELLSSPQMERIVGQLSELAEMVIYDSPPTTLVADAPILAQRVDGAILVIEAGKTRRPQIRQALEALGRTEVRLYGAVLNRVTTGRFAYGRRGYPYRRTAGETIDQPSRFGLQRLLKSLGFVK